MKSMRVINLFPIDKKTRFSTLLSFLLCLGLLQSNLWQQLDKKSFDIATLLLPSLINTSDIIIIGIDDVAFNELNTPWPWPRQWHAQLLHRLNKAGARVVAFDLIFDNPSKFGDADDMSFAEEVLAFSTQGKVLLGAYQQHRMLNEGYQITSIEPISLFQQAGAINANVGITPDSDGVLRSFPQVHDPFWQQALPIKKPLSLGQKTSLQHGGLLMTKPKKLVHFIGSNQSFPYVSYARALNKESLPDHIFKDKTVLIGLDLLAEASLGIGAGDRFLTPYSLIGQTPMAGVEFHANLLINAQHGLAISEISTAFFIGILLLLSFGTALLFKHWQALSSSVLLITLIIALTLGHWVLFSAQLFIPLFSLLLCCSLNFLIQGIFAYHKEQKDRKFISKAFAKYVSPHILHELMINPNKLVLGGTKKSVTIMFTDISGFTQISEQLSPEKVAEILQQHLSIMSDIIVDHGGTLDKYIGDAIMAFWGAPLDDSKQADNALAAAIAMQVACNKMKNELAKKSLPEISMRIGIHTGEAIVGNMGSSTLFDYTCIGDTVNTAARLESLNKEYQTNIIISEQCKEALIAPQRLQLVDYVCVQGKTTIMHVYTPCANQKITILSCKAFKAYQAKDWLKSKKYLLQLLELEVTNTVAKQILLRIEAFERQPPPENWDGALRLSKKC
jgi:adenylate cyclase